MAVLNASGCAHALVQTSRTHEVRKRRRVGKTRTGTVHEDRLTISAILDTSTFKHIGCLPLTASNRCF